MKKRVNGGIATIVAIVTVVGIVLALLISTVIPMANKSHDTGELAVDSLDTLQGKMVP